MAGLSPVSSICRCSRRYIFLLPTVAKAPLQTPPSSDQLCSLFRERALSFPSNRVLLFLPPRRAKNRFSQIHPHHKNEYLYSSLLHLICWESPRRPLPPTFDPKTYSHLSYLSSFLLLSPSPFSFLFTLRSPFALSLSSRGSLFCLWNLHPIPKTSFRSLLTFPSSSFLLV